MKFQSTLLVAALALGATSAFAQSVDAGKRAFDECAACHSTVKGVNGVGPSLAGIVGSKAGEGDGFRYSGPMKRSGIVWTADSLGRYIANPQAVVPGTRMPYSGMQDPEMRASLVKYLETLK